MSDPAILVFQADHLAQASRFAEAEAAYRAAIDADPLFVPAVLGLAHLLLWHGRPEDAADASAALAAQTAAPLPAIEMHVRALVGAGRLEEALPMSRRAGAAGSPHAELGSAQIAANLGRFAEAEAGFRAVLAREPGDERARRGLARALFAGPESVEGAVRAIDAGLAWRWTPSLASFKASVLGQADRPAEALAVMRDALDRKPDAPELHAAAAAAAALDGQAETALAHAEAALRLAPGEEALAALVAEARLGVGDAHGALALIEPLRRAAPLDQKRIALQATAWRLLGDERAQALYDYDRFVRSYTPEPPSGWTSLDAFLAELARTLHAIHDGQGATLDQSVRGGSQTNVDLTRSRDPVLRALFQALESPIGDHVSRLGRGGDLLAEPLAARNRGGFAFSGAWSVRLKPGGRHVNHVHPQGWLSSAFYVDLPETVNGAGQAGWIQFGEPGCPTRPALGPEHAVRPEPGRLVLFPSYMWHGTRPFDGTRSRLTFAFDVVPAEPR